MSAFNEVNPEDSTREMSYASGTTSADSSDHTQRMNFDDYIEWHTATHEAVSNPLLEPTIPPLCSTTDIPDEADRDPEGPNQLGQESAIIAPAPPSATMGSLAANLPYPVTNETIQALRHYAQWTYPELRARFGIPLGSLYRIIHRHSTSQVATRLVNRRQGRRPVVTDTLRSRLIARATANSHNRRLPYTQVAELEGIQLGRRALRRVFESEGYHRRVARQWENISSTDIENLTSSMPNRISALLAAHGGHTRF
ncbi:hypothetical protein HOY82DRAFT_539407 [Tuber indicum]|nr:hypothetical protein HOY82DRAFT_539407 [Tuber indicum]